MKKIILISSMLLALTPSLVLSQTTFDSKTYVETNNTSTNNNVMSGGTNNTNTNINDTKIESVNKNENTNYNYGHTTSDNTNRNINESTSTQTVTTNNKNDNYNKTDIKQKIEQPPPTAIAPSMMSGGNSDLCTTGVSGAVQTQILGISGGGTARDMNCERLKLSKTLYDMGMKVAAVSTLCQDFRVFEAMWNAGTPCPYDGKIGAEARVLWEANPDRIPKLEKVNDNDFYRTLGTGVGLGALLMLLL